MSDVRVAIQFSVTADDMAQAAALSGCPLTLAIERALNRQVQVTRDAVLIRKALWSPADVWPVVIFNEGPAAYWKLPLSASLRRFLKHFDKGRYPKAFSFDVQMEVPEAALSEAKRRG